MRKSGTFRSSTRRLSPSNEVAGGFLRVPTPFNVKLFNEISEQISTYNFSVASMSGDFFCALYPVTLESMGDQWLD
jgi:hypothetical protein